MKGKHSITVGNNILQYKFEICRNITIIKGDSATGKTTLVELIQEYYENGEQSGITLQCDKECVVLEGRQWKVLLQTIQDSIVFIDEGNSFVATDDFADAVKHSDNYYVIVTRESLPALPYSVDEIYGIKSSGKYGTLQKTYQEFYRIYDRPERAEHFCPETVIVEDSNAGYEFFAYIGKEKGWKAVSAKGKSNVFKVLNQYGEDRVLVIADGAAFGPEMDRVVKRLASKKNAVLYLPESFEWLILKSGVVRERKIVTVLENPSEYIESERYMSWEQFFTAFLVEKTSDSYLQYAKGKLNPSYKNEKIADKIVGEIPPGLL